MTRRAWTGLCLLGVALGGCGLKGPLYLPEKSEVKVRPAPAPASATPAQPAESASPASPATPQQPQTPESPPQDPPPGQDRD